MAQNFQKSERTVNGGQCLPNIFTVDDGGWVLLNIIGTGINQRPLRVGIVVHTVLRLWGLKFPPSIVFVENSAID